MEEKMYKHLLALFLFVALFGVSTSSMATRGIVAYMDPAYEMFPGTVYDSEFTQSYSKAFGSVTVPGNASDVFFSVDAHGLKPSTEYQVYADKTGITPKDVKTVGDVVHLGNFMSDKNGSGYFILNDFKFSKLINTKTFSIQVNEHAAHLTMLMSGNLVLE
jgi:hypothetical protein